MNTLSSDLINVVCFHLNASEAHLTNFTELDSSEYLESIKDITKYKLGLKNRNHYWILEKTDRFSSLLKLIVTVEVGVISFAKYYFNKFEARVRREIKNTRNVQLLTNPNQGDDFLSKYNTEFVKNISHYVTLLLVTVYKHGGNYDWLLKRIALLFPCIGEYTDNPKIQYWLGYHRRAVAEQTIEYLGGVVAGGHYDLLLVDRLLPPSSKFTFNQISSVVSCIENEDLAIDIFLKILYNNTIITSNCSFSTSFRMFSSKGMYRMIQTVLMKYTNPSIYDLSHILSEPNGPDLISTEHLLKYNIIFEQVIRYYADRNQTTKLDGLFATIPNYNKIIEILWFDYPQLREYIAEKYKEINGENAPIKYFNLLYQSSPDINSTPIRTPRYKNKEGNIDIIKQYNKAIDSGNYDVIDTDDFCRFMLVSNLPMRNMQLMIKIINLDSLEFLRTIVSRMILFDCDMFFKIFGIWSGAGTYFKTLNNYAKMSTDELKAILKRLGVNFIEDQNKHLLLAEMAKYVH